MVEGLKGDAHAKLCLSGVQQSFQRVLLSAAIPGSS